MEPSAYSSDPKPPGSLPPGNAPQAPQSSNRLLFLILGAVAVLTLAVCCVVLAATSFGGLRLFQSVQRENEQIGATLDQFMQAGASRDAEAARVLFLPENEVSEEDLDSLFRERADAFRSYERINQTNFNISTKNGETAATISGTVVYADGRSGLPFEARLRKEDGGWYLLSIRFREGFGI
ncbi:MAG TPA: hypothetical protein VFS21_07805 [Roseiflexaceae bacterium]|nr:hypothetical protein [Roseiflexaceae bacterium]